MDNKKVINTLPATMMDMGGIPVRQAFPTQQVENIGPFILLHHGNFAVPKGSSPLHSGVGPHPHTGFEPVSIVLDGEVHHRDSLGNSSVIGRDGIQWVRSGRGIVHSERPSRTLAATGGNMEVIQLWINTPKSLKKTPAAYEAHEAENLSKIDFGDGSFIRIIAGELEGKIGPVKPSSELILAVGYVEEGKSLVFNLPEGQDAAIYIPEGKGKLKGHGLVEEYNAYTLSQEGGSVEYNAEKRSRILILSGRALNEKVASYGPFVLTEQTEILEAMRDYQMGKMGILIEE